MRVQTWVSWANVPEQTHRLLYLAVLSRVTVLDTSSYSPRLWRGADGERRSAHSPSSSSPAPGLAFRSRRTSLSVTMSPASASATPVMTDRRKSGFSHSASSRVGIRVTGTSRMDPSSCCSARNSWQGRTSSRPGGPGNGRPCRRGSWLPQSPSCSLTGQMGIAPIESPQAPAKCPLLNVSCPFRKRAVQHTAHRYRRFVLR